MGWSSYLREGKGVDDLSARGRKKKERKDRNGLKCWSYRKIDMLYVFCYLFYMFYVNIVHEIQNYQKQTINCILRSLSNEII